MTTNPNPLFLENWLRSHIKSDDQSSTPPSSAREILQAWADLRTIPLNQTFQNSHHHSLLTLVASRSSLHIADPQAKLLISILNFPLPPQSLTLILRLLYIWIRKSSRPSPSLINITAESLHRISSDLSSADLKPELILLSGAVSRSNFATESSVITCLKLILHIFDEDSSFLHNDTFVPEVLAGVGYALSSRVGDNHPMLLESFNALWGKQNGPSESLPNGILILHLFEYVTASSRGKSTILSGFLSSPKHPPFVRIMSAGGVLRATNEFPVSEPRISAELLLRDANPETGLLLQCVAIAMTRGRVVSASPVTLVKALVREVFPIKRLYSEPDVEDHSKSIIFHEAGSMTAVFCQQYRVSDGETQNVAEEEIWRFCEELYQSHRHAALNADKSTVTRVEKVAESAFLMVVLFASEVAKRGLESRVPVSVSILASFSCVEYFRKILIPEYTDTVRSAVMKLQENESACVMFVESVPRYSEFTDTWQKDKVQTARVSFYMRVIPTCVEKIPPRVFATVAPIMFLYMGCRNGKVAATAHSVFAAFVSSGRDDDVERVGLKEQLAVYYVERSLEGYPGTTPFKGMAGGVSEVARCLPGGSLSAAYCVRRVVEKAGVVEGEPKREIVKLLVRLLFIVDCQMRKDEREDVIGDLYSQVADSDDATRKPALVTWLQSLSYVASDGFSHSRSTWFARL